MNDLLHINAQLCGDGNDDDGVVGTVFEENWCEGVVKTLKDQTNY